MMKATFFSVIPYLGYACLLLSSLYLSKCLMDDPLRNRFVRFKQISRLRKSKVQSQVKQVQNNSPIIRHLYFLLESTSKKGDFQESRVTFFLVFVSLLFAASFTFFLIALEDVFIALIFATLLSVLPYLSLQVKLKKIRDDIAKEFFPLLQALTQRYQRNHNDILLTLKETLTVIESEALRRVLVRLISDLQIADSEEQLRHAINLFVFSSGKNWAKRLGNIIMRGYIYKENILTVLLRLQEKMEKTEQMLSEENSQARDTINDGYLTLLTFPVALGIGYMASGPQDWWSLQFGNNITLSLITLSFIFVVISVFLTGILKNHQNDL